MKIDGNIIAHKGVFNNKDIPENSIDAFKLALKYNYPIELDVQLTRDNVLVVFHDFDLKRMTGINEILSKEDYNTIKHYKLLNTNQHIPKFSEVLNIVKGKVLLDIEIKNTKRIENTCRVLFNELDNYNNYVVKSFNPKIVRYIKNHYPDVEVGLLIGNAYSNKLIRFIMHSKLIIKYSKAEFIAVNKNLLELERYKKLSLQYPTLVWTIVNKDEMKSSKYIYICNNLPYE